VVAGHRDIGTDGSTSLDSQPPSAAEPGLVPVRLAEPLNPLHMMVVVRRRACGLGVEEADVELVGM